MSSPSAVLCFTSLDMIVQSEANITEASDDLTSPTQIKRSRLDSELLSLDPAVYKGMGLKKSEIKRLKKEKERLEKREAKEKERMEVAERKRMRGRCLMFRTSMMEISGWMRRRRGTRRTRGLIDAQRRVQDPC